MSQLTLSYRFGDPLVSVFLFDLSDESAAQSALSSAATRRRPAPEPRTPTIFESARTVDLTHTIYDPAPEPAATPPSSRTSCVLAAADARDGSLAVRVVEVDALTADEWATVLGVDPAAPEPVGDAWSRLAWRQADALSAATLDAVRS